MPKVEVLTKLLEARQQFGYGEQINYFDHLNRIAWIRKGDNEHSGCVVILSNSDEGFKEIDCGKENAHSEYIDFLNQRDDKIITDEKGKGTFWVNSGSVSVWVKNN